MTTFAMIDLETLDTCPDGQILTIGGVKFDPFSDAEPHSEFMFRFDIDEQEALGRTVSESTLDWWSQQSDAAIQAAFGLENRIDCRSVLQALKRWYVGCSSVWSQGSMDTVMIEHMCKQLGEPVPWPYWAAENCRTIINRMPSDPRKELDFVAHDAVADCKAQVYALRKSFKHFGMNK